MAEISNVLKSKNPLKNEMCLSKGENTEHMLTCKQSAE